MPRKRAVPVKQLRLELAQSQLITACETAKAEGVPLSQWIAAAIARAIAENAVPAPLIRGELIGNKASLFLELPADLIGTVDLRLPTGVSRSAFIRLAIHESLPRSVRGRLCVLPR